MKQQDMTVDEALLVADEYGNYSTSSTPGVRALVLLAAEVRRQHAEIERLQSQLDASRRDAERAAGTASKLADQRLVAMADAEAESQKWLDKVINTEVESNRVMTVAQETRLRDFIDNTFGVKP